LEEALCDRPRSGQPGKFTDKQKEKIVAMVCSRPPNGCNRWTVRIIAEESKRRGLTSRISRESVRLILQSHQLKPWREKNVVYIGHTTVQLAFNAGFEALNLPWRSTHICRHTFATITLMETQNLSAVQASLGYMEAGMTQRYAKTVALLSSETGEKTVSAIFKDSHL